jgi:hypothetical protein
VAAGEARVAVLAASALSRVAMNANMAKNLKKGRAEGMARWGSLVGAAMIAVACGGSPKNAPASPGATTASTGAVDAVDSGSAAASPTPAPSASSAAPAPSAGGGAASPGAPAGASVPPPAPAHPFANNASEATSLIDDAITSRVNELTQCVEDARARRKSPHAKLVVEVGIDEEGHMLGVKLPKGEKVDHVFSDCVLAALRGAPFPKSHSGVITVRKTFEDKAVYR